MSWRSLLLLATVLAVAVGSACSTASSSATAWQIGAPDTSPGGDWDNAVHFLQLGDAATARIDMDRSAAAGEGAKATEPSLFYRDLAEARLFGGDSPGAAEAARLAQMALDARPETAQFRAPDRRLFEDEVDALAAASQGDVDRLASIATRDALVADPWYLLGWLDEQAGDRGAADRAYRAYLARAPEGSFLRQAAFMRRRAASFVAAPGA